MRTRLLFFVRPMRRMLSLAIIFTLGVGLSEAAFANSKYAGIVVDANTGKWLYAEHAESYRYPASLTKMMTLYLMFEALERGKLTKKTRIRFSRYAASRPPSKLGLKAGQTLSAQQAIYALVTKSANDVATAVAEHLAGSEAKFARIMTKRARQLGMEKTVFKNASGLTAKGQHTTARDMARLGIALREHYPHYYKYFSTRVYRFGKRKFPNHNRLLGKVRGMDGIKTGYTRLSGYNLVSSVRTNDRSVVAVVMGGKSGKSRNAQMARLINRYTRKATRRAKKHLLIAKIYNHGSIRLAANTKLPKRGPFPVYRSNMRDPVQIRIEQAHSSQLAYTHEQNSLSSKAINAIRHKLISMRSEHTPIPVMNPQNEIDQIQTASLEPRAKSGLAVMEPGKFRTSRINSGLAAIEPGKYRNKSKGEPNLVIGNPGGWQVQVGALPNQESAQNLLKKLRNKNRSVFATSRSGSLQNYLEPVNKNGTTLFRARIVGFSSKKAAQNACRRFKKNHFNCLALKG